MGGELAYGMVVGGSGGLGMALAEKVPEDVMGGWGEAGSKDG